MHPKTYTLSDIKTANRVRGLYFFSRDTLRFFRSRISARVHQGPGGIYFVTSEQFDERSPRLYTVRCFNPASAGIDTVGEFQEHPTAYQAHAEAARLAAQVSTPASC
ncbi:hypothetical protein QMK33_06810 [Hymenobacter sp. H14-R3]|uniref:DUF7447 family protein n=1 Tax=Hymenobacter sp. H14-R3 TaxID=3046308 RepID=UPI0024B8D193|nr:hypothetical protein [Hymenobacter sp. H14-R3]MDJ0364858.1 hypothetical protein [Hymenobacter sp. H14-R3]